MDRIVIQFTTGNSAFDESPASEIAHVLRHIANQFETGQDVGPIFDRNGNYIGHVCVRKMDLTEDKDQE